MRLDHCCLNVRDMDASIRFYEESFGMTLLSRRDVWETHAEIAFLGFADAGEGAMKLELTHWRSWKPEDYTEGSGFDHIALVVEDVRGLVTRLRDRDVRIAREPYALQGSRSTLAFVHDPDGNWIELIERA